MRRFLVLLIAALIVPGIVPAANPENIDSSPTHKIDVSKAVDTGTGESIYKITAEMPSSSISGLSFHVSSNADNRWSLSRETEGELKYGYFEYQGRQSDITTRIGRQQITNSLLYSDLDGIAVHSQFDSTLDASLFAGSPALQTDEITPTEGTTYGAYILYRKSRYHFRLTYQNIHYSAARQQAAGLTFRSELPFKLNLSGRNQYIEDTTPQNTYYYRLGLGQLWIKPLVSLLLSNTYAPEVALIAGKDDEDSFLGASLSFNSLPSVTIEFNAKGYDLVGAAETANSYYYSTNIKWHRPSTRPSKCYIGGETGIMVSDSEAEEYYLVRLYSGWENTGDVPFIDSFNTALTYKEYEQLSSDEDKEILLSFGCAKKLLDDNFSIKLKGLISQAPDEEDNLQGGISFDYHFAN